MLNLEKR